MPKKAIDYSKCVIYKIVCNDLDVKDLYVGHTTDFRRRKNRHKHSCYNEALPAYTFKVYEMIRANGGWDNWSMIEVEKYACSDSNEAISRERHWYEALQANLNSDYPGRTTKERYDKNREIINEKKKTHYQLNRERILLEQKAYVEKNKEVVSERRKEKIKCECAYVYTKSNRARHLKSKVHCDFIESK